MLFLSNNTIVITADSEGQLDQRFCSLAQGHELKCTTDEDLVEYDCNAPELDQAARVAVTKICYSKPGVKFRNEAKNAADQALANLNKVATVRARIQNRINELEAKQKNDRFSFGISKLKQKRLQGILDAYDNHTTLNKVLTKKGLTTQAILRFGWNAKTATMLDKIRDEQLDTVQSQDYTSLASPQQ